MSSRLLTPTLVLALVGCGGAAEPGAAEPGPAEPAAPQAGGTVGPRDADGIEPGTMARTPSAGPTAEERLREVDRLPVDDAACPTLGTWRARLDEPPRDGASFVLRVTDTGDTRAVGGPNAVNQAWSLYGDVLSVQDPSTSRYTGPCDADRNVAYAVEMTSQCRRMRLEAQHDPCDARRALMDGLVLERQP